MIYCRTTVIAIIVLLSTGCSDVTYGPEDLETWYERGTGLEFPPESNVLGKLTFGRHMYLKLQVEESYFDMLIRYLEPDNYERTIGLPRFAKDWEDWDIKGRDLVFFRRDEGEVWAKVGFEENSGLMFCYIGMPDICVLPYQSNTDSEPGEARSAEKLLGDWLTP